MSKSPKKRQKPAVILSKVPSIKQICESLGFQNATSKDTDKFLDTIRAFRKSHQLSSGTSQTDLLRWNDPRIQFELKHMAEKFLGDGDNGDKYWGSKRYWEPAGLQYPDDSERIVALLMQLFFRQTKYAFNNERYSHKNPDVIDASKDNTAPSTSTFSQRRPTPSSTTAPGDSQDSRLSEAAVHDPRVVIQSTTLLRGRTFHSSDSGNKSLREVDVLEGPDDLVKLTPPPLLPSKTDPRQPQSVKRTNHFLDAEPQPYPPPLPISTSSSNGPRKKRKLGKEECSFDQHSTVEIIHHSEDRVDHIFANYRPLAGKAFEAPIAPMINPSAKLKSLVNGPKTSQPENSKTTEKAMTPSDTPRTMKSLNDNFHLNGNTSHGGNPVVHYDAPPPLNDVENPPHTTTVDQRLSSDGSLDSRQCQARMVDNRSIAGSSKSTSCSQRATRLLYKAVGGELAAMDPKIVPDQPNENSCAPVPVDVTILRSPLRDSTPRTAATTPNAIVQSEQAEPANIAEKPLTMRPSTLTTQGTPATQSSRTHLPPLAVLPQTSPTKLSPSPVPMSRSKFQVPLWVITHTDVTTEELWEKGGMSGLTFPSFLASLSPLTSHPVDSINKIKFTLCTPDLNTKMAVAREAEDSWKRVVVTFKEKLRGVGRRVEQCRILIEPVWEEVLGKERGDGMEEVSGEERGDGVEEDIEF